MILCPSWIRHPLKERKQDGFKLRSEVQYLSQWQVLLPLLLSAKRETYLKVTQYFKENAGEKENAFKGAGTLLGYF